MHFFSTSLLSRIHNRGKITIIVTYFIDKNTKNSKIIILTNNSFVFIIQREILMSDNKKTIPVFERYAIFQTGGKQYQAIEGKTIAIEKLEGNQGDSVEFEEVLLRKTGHNDIQIGQPYLQTPIKASIVKQMRGPKLVVFKFKRRKKSRVKKGHRQSLTVIRIEAI